MVNLILIKEKRRSRGIPGMKLAEMLNMSESSYWSKEGGWRKWKLEELIILSDIYNCTLDEFIIRKRKVDK